MSPRPNQDPNETTPELELLNSKGGRETKGRKDDVESSDDSSEGDDSSSDEE